MMATAVRQKTAAAGTAADNRSTVAQAAPDNELRVGWAVRNRAGQVVVIYEGTTARVVAEEWAGDRGYTVEAVTL